MQLYVMFEFFGIMEILVFLGESLTSTFVAGFLQEIETMCCSTN